MTVWKEFIIIKKNKKLNRKKKRCTKDMTFFLLESIDLVSSALWKTCQNAGSSSDIVLFLDTSWGNPNFGANYGGSTGDTISWMQDLVLINPIPGWFAYEPWMNNIKLRSTIFGFIVKVQDAPQTSDDCVDTPIRPGDMY